MPHPLRIGARKVNKFRPFASVQKYHWCSISAQCKYNNSIGARKVDEIRPFAGAIFSVSVRAVGLQWKETSPQNICHPRRPSKIVPKQADQLRRWNASSLNLTFLTPKKLNCSPQLGLAFQDYHTPDFPGYPADFSPPEKNSIPGRGIGDFFEQKRSTWNAIKLPIHTKFVANSYHFCRQFIHFFSPTWFRRFFFI